MALCFKNNSIHFTISCYYRLNKKILKFEQIELIVHTTRPQFIVNSNKEILFVRIIV